MSDIKLVCPVCGGSLKASYGEDSAVCAYCGANVDLKSAIAKLQTEHAMEISVMADNILGLLADKKFAEAQMMANKCLKKNAVCRQAVYVSADVRILCGRAPKARFDW